MAKDPMATAVVVREDETLGNLLGERLKIIQKARGYRYSLDALLLAHFVTLKEGERVCDMGTGSGIIPLILADRSDCAVVGVEIQGEMADMARRSVAVNGLAHRVAILRGDINDVEKLLAPRCFDVVTANPPYRRRSSGRINPQDEKAVARHEIAGSLASFLRASDHILKAKGRVYVIYPAARIAELLFRMREQHMEPKRLRIVHSTIRSAGKFVLAEGSKGGGEEAKIMPPLFIYEDGGAYTEEMQQIMRDLSAPSAAFGG